MTNEHFVTLMRLLPADVQVDVKRDMAEAVRHGFVPLNPTYWHEYALNRTRVYQEQDERLRGLKEEFDFVSKLHEAESQAAANWLKAVQKAKNPGPLLIRLQRKKALYARLLNLELGRLTGVIKNVQARDVYVERPINSVYNQGCDPGDEADFSGLRD
jgi:hypothetical protein